MEQLEGAESYQNHKDEEFINKPADDMEEGGTLKEGRRNFMKVTGAAAIFAGASGCNPERKLVPYLEQPEELIPGNPVFYASLDATGENGLVVKTTEARPIKLDGNDAYPTNSGKLDAAGNAAILDLYDPDRLRGPVMQAEGKWEEITDLSAQIQKIATGLKSAAGKAYFVTPPIHGPAQKALIAEFLKAYPSLKHVEISNPVGLNLEATLASQEACYGQRVLPSYRYDKAKLIVSLGYDFLSDSPNGVEVNRLFADARRYKDDGSMARSVMFEPTLSVTGATGDERVRVEPAALPAIAIALLKELSTLGAKIPAGVNLSIDGAGVEKTYGVKEGFIHSLAEELWAHKGQGLVLAGGLGAAIDGGELLANATNLLNSVLGNDGKTIQYGDGSLKAYETKVNGVQSLLADLKAGKVEALVLMDVNPSYELAASTGFNELFEKVALKVGLVTHLNETGKRCDVVLPPHHFLENWSDSEARSGLYGLGQPTIAPLWKTESKQDYLIKLAVAAGSTSLQANGSAVAWSDYLKTQWSKKVYNTNVFASSFDAFFDSALRKGFVDLNKSGREKVLAARKVNMAVFKGAALTENKPGLKLVIHQSPLHGSGHSMNNPWLLEAPDPVSKITWDNYVSVSVATAKKNGYEEGNIVKVTTEAGTLEIPVHIQPGTHDNVYALAAGWGRGPEAGQVAAGPTGKGLGVDANALVAADGVKSGIAMTVSKTSKEYNLACVQGHQYLENPFIRMTGEGSRKIVQETTLKQFNDPKDNSYEIKYHMPTDITMWRQKFASQTHKWGMVIDTNVCTGCNACMVSCQAENNISTVGKDEVLLNREMHWIRIDRYYTAVDEVADDVVENADEVDVIQQPMLCQHCDNAPCETVCPVVATTHNEEGLNVQTYNRCVGTRYCSNNCPYKVRHYNWYDYSDYRGGLHDSGAPLRRFLRSLGLMGDELKDKTEYPLMLQFNPDVTVRSRGVMEKCSFCSHKIRRWHTEEKALGRDLPESAKQTACQKACPADAIVFGNVLDTESSVSESLERKGNYKVLKELNVEANVTYLTRLKNREPLANAVKDDHGAGHGDDHGAGHGDSHSSSFAPEDSHKA